MTISVNSKKKQVKKTFQELINDLMSSSSEKVRYNAARVLGEMGDSKAVEPLIDVLKNDKNGSVRLYAARALGELGDSKATEHLIESLREDRNVDRSILPRIPCLVPFEWPDRIKPLLRGC